MILFCDLSVFCHIKLRMNFIDDGSLFQKEDFTDKSLKGEFIVEGKQAGLLCEASRVRYSCKSSSSVSKTLPV